MKDIKEIQRKHWEELKMEMNLSKEIIEEYEQMLQEE